MIWQKIDNVLRANLYTWFGIGVGDFTGAINTEEMFTMISSVLSYDSLMRIFLMISAATGAIYGIYRTIDLIVKFINKLKKKNK